MKKEKKDSRKNLKVSEDIHKGLKHLAYQRRETLGVTLKKLLNEALLADVFGKKKSKEDFSIC